MQALVIIRTLSFDQAWWHTSVMLLLDTTQLHDTSYFIKILSVSELPTLWSYRSPHKHFTTELLVKWIIYLLFLVYLKANIFKLEDKNSFISENNYIAQLQNYYFNCNNQFLTFAMQLYISVNKENLINFYMFDT